jgi:hypothetical protein
MSGAAVTANGPCAFMWNDAEFGEGGDVYGVSSSSFTSTTATAPFEMNWAETKGGAVSLHESVPEVIRATFVMNTARTLHGGSVFGQSSSITDTASSLTSNAADDNGGGVASVVSNAADDNRGGIASVASQSSSITDTASSVVIDNKARLYAAQIEVDEV